MENKVLQENLNIISKYNKNLVEELNNINKYNSILELKFSKNQQYNLFYNGIPLHSQDNPIEEAKNIASKISILNKDNSIIVVLGFNLGYLVDELSAATTNPNSKIIVYEPNIDVLHFVLSIANVDAINKNNVFICTNKNDLRKFIKENSSKDSKISLCFLNSYKKIGNNESDDIVKLIERVQGEFFAYQNTLSSKSKVAISNSFKNLKYILKNPNIDSLKDIYKDKTALVLSCGPSLRENIEKIKEIKDKCIIIAISPTLKLLKQYNITPDFIVNVETVNQTPQLQYVEDKKSYFILETFSNPSFVKQADLKAKKVFNYISNNNFINYWIKECANFNTELETLGTVSYSAFYSAYLMGFKKIILCGQDLAYKNGACYAKGTQFEDLECVFDDKLNKYVIKINDIDNYIKSTNFKDIKDENVKKNHIKGYLKFLNDNLYTTKAQDGSLIPTQSGYAIFIDWFCELANKIHKISPDIILINSSTNGAQIDGFKNLDITEAFKNNEKIEKLDLSLYKETYDKNATKEKLNRFIEKMQQFLKTLENLNLNCAKLKKEFSYRKTITTKIEKLLSKQKELIKQLQFYYQDKELNFIVKIYFLENFSKLPEINLNNIDEFIKYLNNLEQICIKNIDNIHSNIIDLTDCKSFIFK